jgi:hypothetical protein
MKRCSVLLPLGSALALAIAVAVPAGASTPASSGTVSPPASGQSATYSWSGTIPGGVNANSDCSQSVSDSLNDQHTVTFDIPTGFYSSHTLLASFTITPSPAVDDVILTVEQGSTVVGSSDNGGNGAAETVAVANPASATFDALACAFDGGPQPYTGTLTVQTDPPGAAPGGGATDITPATYQNYAAPAGLGDDAGEPSIGVNWNTNVANGGTVMYLAGTQTLRVVFTGTGSTASATWTDVSAPNTSLTTLDPILDTDSVHGRTFVSQLSGQDSLAAFSDDDGASWTPSQGGGIPSGVDHQSVGNGPYPAGATPGPLTSYPNAVYYCSQDLVTAFCARSDTGGLTFGPGVPIYTTECGGLHGHVRVSPDGTVYVPNKSCEGRQGLAVSTDAGLSWTVHTVPNTTPGDSDPSVGVAADNSIYEGYVNGDGKPEIARSTDRGATWGQPVDVGATLGIQNAVFPEVIAGDGNRAAFAFLGTTTPGNYNDPTFGESADGTTYTGGTWDLYVATTDDAGATWNTVDATPKDPVQRGSICTTGTTCGSNRNLLDFNDISVDNTGHVLVAYADGCTAACITSTAVANNPQTAKASIARQVAGTGMFAANDPAPTVKGHKGKHVGHG